MYIVTAVLTSFIVAFILLPIIIEVSTSIDLLDSPDRRKIHHISTPSLGGVAIFSGFILATIIALPFSELLTQKYLLVGAALIFFLGVRDDILNLKAYEKLLIQLFAAFLVVYMAEIRLTGLYGILGIELMPEWFNISFSIFIIIALTNAYNLIDGIDGLAGGVGVFILTFFGWAFLMMDQLGLAIISLSLVGSLIAFLFFNWNPSKIFMGDTGSMMIGFIVSIMAVNFINLTSVNNSVYGFLQFEASIGLVVALMIVPIYDTLRVFVIRLFQGKNPLDPDRNHIHHGLLILGLSHSQSTLAILTMNAVVFSVAIFLSPYLQNGELLLVVLLTTLLITSVFEFKLIQIRITRKTISISTAKKELYLSKSA